jgi:hypothetical protein
MERIKNMKRYQSLKQRAMEIDVRDPVSYRDEPTDVKNTPTNIFIRSISQIKTFLNQPRKVLILVFSNESLAKKFESGSDFSLIQTYIDQNGITEKVYYLPLRDFNKWQGE